MVLKKGLKITCRGQSGNLWEVTKVTKRSTYLTRVKDKITHVIDNVNLCKYIIEVPEFPIKVKRKRKKVKHG